MQKRVQSSAGDQTGSKLHRWGRPSASARMGKNKLGMPLSVLIAVLRPECKRVPLLQFSMLATN